MTVAELKDQIGEGPAAMHVVVADLKNDLRLEIEAIWVDRDGVLNIITDGRTSGTAHPDLRSEALPETVEDDE